MLLPLRFASQRPPCLLQELRSHLGACWKRGRVPKKSFQKDKWNGKFGICLSFLLFWVTPRDARHSNSICQERFGFAGLCWHQKWSKRGIFSHLCGIWGFCTLPTCHLHVQTPKNLKMDPKTSWDFQMWLIKAAIDLLVQKAGWGGSF